ncbi:MAG: amidohydrolase [Firmicutes bacterium]|nr:amidohydrolase [Bacillota bacterium]
MNKHVDLVLVNGRVVTMDWRLPLAKSVAIAGEKIIWVGDDPESAGVIGKHSRVVDLGGRVTLPGFIDAHVHFMQTGLDETALNLSGTRNLEALFSVIKDRAGSLPGREWLRAYGYDETRLEEKRHPTLAEIDSVTGEKPTFISRIDAHSCLVNSTAFRLLEVPGGTEGVETDSEGHFTGRLFAVANGYARKRLVEVLLDNDARRRALMLAARKALRVGITTVHALEGGSLFSDKDVDALLDIQDELPLRTVLYHQIMELDKIAARGLKRVGGCITVDGSLGSRTAALLEPYADAPGHKGILYYSDEEVQEFVSRANKAGLQIAMHTIGDGAIEQLMRAYEKALSEYPRPDHRHRFEHFSVPTHDQIERAARIGAAVCIQPAFDLYTSYTMMPVRLGPERFQRAYPQRTLLEAGLLVGGGSDSSITPINPMLGVHSAVNHSHCEERLSVFESLRLFTLDAAALAFEEGAKGTITPGKLGDIAVLAENPFTADTDSLKDITVQMTIVGGKVVYEANY